MSTIRTASWGFLGLKRATRQCLSSTMATSSRPASTSSTQTPSCRSTRSNRTLQRFPPNSAQIFRRSAQAQRTFSATSTAAHGHITPPRPGEELHVTFIDKDGEEHTLEVAAGDNLLDVAQENDLDMEGACGGSCACSTCHVIVESEDLYDKMPEPDDDENDMLDLAFGLTETSRLGCQVVMSKELDGLRIRLPSMTRNLQASDFSK